MPIDREKIIVKQMIYCQHYIAPLRGVKACKCGVVYDEQFPKKPTACWTGGGKTDQDQLLRCPKWLRRTVEQSEARADELEALLRTMAPIYPVVTEWRNKPPIGKYEVIECPACQGKLHLTQAGCNGHVHGKCETDGCANWME